MLVLVSYIPFLRGVPGALMDPSEVAPLLDTDAGHVDAVVWAVGDGGEYSPVFAMARADEVFEHLVEWSDGSPASWFKLVVDESEEEYAMALVPDVQRSLDRFHLARSAVAGAEVLPEEVRVVFQPLIFRGTKSDVSRRVLPSLRDEVTVGFVDVETVRAGIERLDPRAASRIGPLRCAASAIRTSSLGADRAGDDASSGPQAEGVPVKLRGERERVDDLGAADT